MPGFDVAVVYGFVEYFIPMDERARTVVHPPGLPTPPKEMSEFSALK
jgi:hypothetical protein